MQCTCRNPKLWKQFDLIIIAEGVARGDKMTFPEGEFRLFISLKTKGYIQYFMVDLPGFWWRKRRVACIIHDVTNVPCTIVNVNPGRHGLPPLSDSIFTANLVFKHWTNSIDQYNFLILDAVILLEPVKHCFDAIPAILAAFRLLLKCEWVKNHVDVVCNGFFANPYVGLGLPKCKSTNEKQRFHDG